MDNGEWWARIAECVGVWYHCTFTNGMRFQMGLVSLQQCDSVAIYDAIMQIE